jgi:hypothetical protein
MDNIQVIIDELLFKSPVIALNNAVDFRTPRVITHPRAFLSLSPLRPL